MERRCPATVDDADRFQAEVDVVGRDQEEIFATDPESRKYLVDYPVAWGEDDVRNVLRNRPGDSGAVQNLDQLRQNAVHKMLKRLPVWNEQRADGPPVNVRFVFIIFGRAKLRLWSEPATFLLHVHNAVPYEPHRSDQLVVGGKIQIPTIDFAGKKQRSVVVGDETWKTRGKVWILHLYLVVLETQP